ncbi:MAG: GGDEF domain-containing protein [Hyphomicrobiales bacterium]|nr:GGDEF domain-containing protein [Hyphomicrobiales bacterium]
MNELNQSRSSVNIDDFEVFPWNKNFETGNTKIDEQHKVLVDLLNKLARSLIDGDVVDVSKAFEALSNYASHHFGEEEVIWAQYFAKDNWFSSHQMSHAAFLPKVVDIKETGAGKPLSEIIEQLVKFLIRWLAFHIIDVDKRMAMAVEAIDSGASIDEAKIEADKKMSGSMRLLIETVLEMYDILSSRAIDLMRERIARKVAEEKLKEAYRKLEEMSVTDELTGLYNRRHLVNVFDTEIRRARREKTTLTYYLIDIDCFKRFNDKYGHVDGDDALKRVGKALKELCRRAGDFAFRVGGEEFAIIALGQTVEEARKLGEIIRSSIETLRIPHRNSDAGDCVTVSVGAVCMEPSSEDTLDVFSRNADKSLYRAKAMGKNKLILFD